MDDLTFLPFLNACLNGCACLLISVGFVLVKRGYKRAHAAFMLAATLVSTVFLASYLTYHFVVVPEVGHTTFNREGALKTAYYVMLLSHILLAAINLPMILITLWRAYKLDWVRHARIARLCFPIWFYVSITGVLVYLALYRFNPPPPPQ